MSYEVILSTVQFGMGLCVLLVIYKFVYQKTRLERFREDLFTMRDDLFDYMWKNNLSYDVPAYREMRRMLNGFILVAHKFNIGGFLIGVSLSPEKTPEDGLCSKISSITDEKFKDYLLKLYVAIGMRVLRFIFLEGPLWIVFEPLGWAARHLPSIKGWFVNRYATVAAAAAKFGGPDAMPHAAHAS